LPALGWLKLNTPPDGPQGLTGAFAPCAKDPKACGYLKASHMRRRLKRSNSFGAAGDFFGHLRTFASTTRAPA